MINGPLGRVQRVHHSEDEKKGTTKSTKKSFSFPLCSLCALWFKAFMLFATTSKMGAFYYEKLKVDQAQSART